MLVYFIHHVHVNSALVFNDNRDRPHAERILVLPLCSPKSRSSFGSRFHNIQDIIGLLLVILRFAARVKI